MNTVYASIYLYLPEFLSLVFYSFLSTSLLPPGLNLFLGIFFFFARENGIFFLSFSDSSLLVYKNALDFWILTFYPAILLKSLIRPSSFLVETLGFSMQTIMSSEYNDNFTSCFPIWMPFISSSCQIFVARTSSTILKKSGEIGHLCLIPDVEGNACSFSLMSMMLAVGLSFVAFIWFRYAPSIPTLLRDFFFLS